LLHFLLLGVFSALFLLFHLSQSSTSFTLLSLLLTLQFRHGVLLLTLTDALLGPIEQRLSPAAATADVARELIGFMSSLFTAPENIKKLAKIQKCDEKMCLVRRGRRRTIFHPILFFYLQLLLSIPARGMDRRLGQFCSAGSPRLINPTCDDALVVFVPNQQNSANGCIRNSAVEAQKIKCKNDATVGFFGVCSRHEKRNETQKII
jgi:hypothetical protein